MDKREQALAQTLPFIKHKHGICLDLVPTGLNPPPSPAPHALWNLIMPHMWPVDIAIISQGYAQLGYL